MAHSNNFLRGNYLGDEHFHFNRNNGDSVHVLICWSFDYWPCYPASTASVNEVPSLIDPYSDMRLDIDHMSYEELLELGEWISNVDKGLLQDIIARQMRTKTYLLPNDSEGSTSKEQEFDICVICQDEYKNKEEIGILQCKHEYHADCIRRWLHEKNVCPMCKSKH
ncbi:probable E3 ubiquitin-protein ligase ZFP1 [Vigna angularis]|uniref:probable E3 ubiquitin-protein ligase ZFP1 n=1 Tax=Phaseolus angularis TaxID=3914 RepID=UPI00080A567A|nr:probable E3 ubiquitin-protein ligase ZFP1 [Vigna angularis]